MTDEREKVEKKTEEPDVEGHKVLKATDEADDEGPDVEAHKLHTKVEHKVEH